MYIKYGWDESGRVWRVCNFMTQTQSDLLLKKKIVTQPNPPSLKNRPNPVGRVRSGRVGFGGLAGFLHTPI